MIQLQHALLLSAVIVGVACAKPPPATTPPPPAVATDPEAASDTEVRKVADAPEGPESPAVVERSGNGARSPGGRFTTSKGTPLDLAKATEQRGAVLVFYRGSWCKQCIRQLKELSAVADSLRRRGFDVYGISTDAPEQSAKLIRSARLDFELLSDPGGIAISAWNVYSPEHDLARAAVFVIAPGGAIEYQYVSDSPSDRPAVAVIEKAVERVAPPEDAAVQR